MKYQLRSLKQGLKLLGISPLGPASRRWQIAMTRQAAILLARQIELLPVVRLRGTCGEGLGRHFPNLNLEYFFFPVS